MQAKASAASSSSAEHSGMRFPTSGAISKMPAQNTLAQSSRSSGVKLNLVAGEFAVISEEVELIEMTLRCGATAWPAG